ncbi:hypothetical protein ACFE04_002574 [Oxalis oulophora]
MNCFLLDLTGDDEFYTFHKSVDAAYPSHKRARTVSRFVQEFDKKPSINVLPDECLFEIFRHVSGGAERSACAAVSKHWLTLMGSIRKSEFYDTEMSSSDDEEDDGHLTRCLEGKKANDMRLAAIAVRASTRGSLGKLSIRRSNANRGVTDFGLSAVARGCPSLKTLSLWSVPGVGDQGLISIAKECRFLEKLDLMECPSISSKGLIAIAENCQNLSVLNIDSCANICNKGLVAIGKLCPKLQSVSIIDCPLIGDLGIANLLFSASNSMRRVKLQNLSVTDVSLAVIGTYGKAINNLALYDLQTVTAGGFWALGNPLGLKRLINLTISSCRGVTDDNLGAIGKTCTNLKKMCLGKCCFVSDDGLVGFVKAAKALESLQLEECNRVSQNGIIGSLSNLKSLTLVKCMGIKETPLEICLPSHCDSLKSLCVRNCLSVGDTSLALIGELCPQLQNVELTGLCGVTESGLLPIIVNSKAGLVKVNLSGCVNITDNVVSALTRLHGLTLETLNLDNCWKITDSSLMAIAENCLLLRELYLSRCGITDAGIVVLSYSKKLTLEVLSLSRCSAISNASVPYLERIGITLTCLILQRCNLISSSSIDQLSASLWRCDILA